MMHKKKIGIYIGILIIGVMLWQYGFFTRFNYLTAQIDIWRDSPRIASVGELSHPCGVPCIGLKEEYGFHESNLGCSVSSSQLRGIKSYNKQIEKYLIKRNGKDWKEKFQSKMDLLIKNNLLE